MDNLFMGLIALVILGIVVVLIYLVDRINAIEGRSSLADAASQALNTVAAVASTVDANNGFNGFSGKKLWDAVCGKANPPLEAAELASLRERYEPILEKHILEVIQDGAKDVAAGTTNSPKATREIKTLRASVESYLPAQHVSALYKAGYEAASNPDDIPRIAQSVDETCDTLYARCDLALVNPFSTRVFGDANAGNDPALLDSPDVSGASNESLGDELSDGLGDMADDLENFSVEAVSRKPTKR